MLFCSSSSELIALQSWSGEDSSQKFRTKHLLKCIQTINLVIKSFSSHACFSLLRNFIYKIFSHDVSSLSWGASRLFIPFLFSTALWIPGWFVSAGGMYSIFSSLEEISGDWMRCGEVTQTKWSLSNLSVLDSNHKVAYVTVISLAEAILKIFLLSCQYLSPCLVLLLPSPSLLQWKKRKNRRTENLWIYMTSSLSPGSVPTYLLLPLLVHHNVSALCYSPCVKLRGSVKPVAEEVWHYGVSALQAKFEVCQTAV